MPDLPAEPFGPVCDASPVSMTWEPGGRDFTVELVFPAGDKHRYTFTWVSRLRIAIDQGRGGPSPISWDGDAVRLPDGRLSVLIDFADQGELRLECEAIVVSRPEAQPGRATEQP